jgi:hypothetical protein
MITEILGEAVRSQRLLVRPATSLDVGSEAKKMFDSEAVSNQEVRAAKPRAKRYEVMYD